MTSKFKFPRQNKCTKLPKIEDTSVHLFSHDFSVILEVIYRDLVWFSANWWDFNAENQLDFSSRSDRLKFDRQLAIQRIQKLRFPSPS